MELTDEQYSQVLKYVDKEMDKAESAAFKARLTQKEELDKEVELYREIRSLGASIEKKIDAVSFVPSEKKSEDDDIEIIINQARKNWENKYEDDLKLKYQISVAETNDFRPDLVSKVKKMNVWIKYGAVAAISGVIFLVSTLFFKSTEKKSEMAIENEKTSSKIVKDKPGITSNTQIKTSEEENTRNFKEGRIQQDKTKFEVEAEGKRVAQKKSEVNPDALFEANFIPDAIPNDDLTPLHDALALYKNKKYIEAVQAFENIDLGPVTRSDEGSNHELYRFYISYYKGLSYLSIDSASKAIAEFENAKSRDRFLQHKINWNLCLAYLKTKQTIKASALLKQISKDNDAKAYKQKAKILLKKLDKMK